MPTLEEFRNKTGVFAPENEQEPSQDAAAKIEETETEMGGDEIEENVEQEQDVNEEDELETSPDEQKGTVETFEQDGLPELSEKEKPAFVKRLEAEKKKLAEQLRKELESQYNPYKEVVDLLGGDINRIKEAIQENQIMMEAQRMANQYGWDEEQMNFYIQQQQAIKQQERLQQELQELRIANEINDLRDNPAFSGIKEMKKEIMDLVKRSNGALTVQQAYWALGGAKRAEQMRLEAEQRAAVKRAEMRRTPQNDHAAIAPGPKPLPPEILQQARRMGLTEQQARELLEFDATNILEARQKMKKR